MFVEEPSLPINNVADLLSLVAEISLQDVDDLKGRQKGKNIAGSLTDEEFALQLFAEEARALQSFVRDMSFAHSIGEALCADADLLEEHAFTEEIARRDREIARAIAGGRPIPTTQPTIPVSPITSASSLSTAKPLISNPTKFSVFTETSAQSARSSVVLRPTTSSSATKISENSKEARPKTCVICRDDIHGLIIRAPCGHPYDVKCLLDLFRAATIDESLFPPSCCRKPFDLVSVRPFLNRELAALVDTKAVEFGTKDRVYCHRPACSAFLGSATPAAARLTCIECRAQTCSHCKAAAHSPLIRCTSSEDEGVIALAGQEGWKRCPGCGHLVELTLGCYHMTCRCRYQFCYLCAAQWKTCRCTQWDEQRLFVAAEDRVQRQRQIEGRGRVAAPVPIAEHRRVVAREAERLRVNHYCEHRWRYVSGGGNCEGCGHYLPLFLFDCRGCHMSVCARCRRNRWL